MPMTPPRMPLPVSSFDLGGEACIHQWMRSRRRRSTAPGAGTMVGLNI